MLKSKSAVFYIHLITLILGIVGIVFFGLSYTTGYNSSIGVNYGERNSITITVMLAIMVVITMLSIILQITGKVQVKELYNLIVFALVILLTLSTILLLVDRVEPIGNCIIAPWDAGHGGEESVYLSCVSMGCWLVALVCNIVASFLGYKVKKA